MNQLEYSIAIDRRTALRLLTSSAGLALLAACGAPAPTSVPPTQPAPSGPAAGNTPAAAQPSTAQASATVTPSVAQVSAPAAAQPRTGGTLRAGIPADIPSLDGHISSSSNPYTLNLMFDRLVEYTTKLEPQPMLAESWDTATDYKLFKLNLRKGVQFHNGREMNSEDVKWNLERGRDPKAGTGSYVNQANWIQEIETPDKYTVVIKAEQSRPAMFDYFNQLNIVDRETVTGPEARTKAVGTGPFVFQEWVQGDHLALTKNKNYWKTGRPYLDGYTANVTRDVVAMATRLEGGGLEVINSPSLEDFVRLKADPKYVAVLAQGQQSCLGVGVNTLFPPTDDKKVRQALNYAIDRKRFAETVMRGVVPAVSLPWDADNPAYEASKHNFFSFDLDKARSLLAEAGVTGAELDFLASPNNPEFEGFAQIFQADLARLGIKLTITKFDQAAWLDQVNNRKYKGFWASTIAVPLGEPATAFLFGRGTDPRSNNEGYKNDRYEQLILTAASEPDPAKRKPIYSQLNDILLEDSFIMSMAPFPPRIVAKATVHDVAVPGRPSFAYWDAWLED
jgi:peptide/nickel transport system substrate-binding protein